MRRYQTNDMEATFRYPPLVYPVVSNEYKLATQLLQSILQNGLINLQEYERINAANTQTFICAARAK